MAWGQGLGIQGPGLGFIGLGLYGPGSEFGGVRIQGPGLGFRVLGPRAGFKDVMAQARALG